MDKLLEILNEINPDVDYENEDSLVDDNILTSFELVILINRISEEFDIDISPDDIVPEKFNSIESIMKLIKEAEED